MSPRLKPTLYVGTFISTPTATRLDIRTESAVAVDGGGVVVRVWGVGGGGGVGGEGEGNKGDGVSGVRDEGDGGEEGVSGGVSGVSGEGGAEEEAVKWAERNGFEVVRGGGGGGDGRGWWFPGFVGEFFSFGLGVVLCCWGCFVVCFWVGGGRGWGHGGCLQMGNIAWKGGGDECFIWV